MKKALYGTKQAANAWQKFLRGKFLSIGAKMHPKDECVYIFRHDDEWALVSTHVDDIFALYDPCGKFGWKQKVLKVLEEAMTVENMGTVAWALDTKIQRDPVEGILKISQGAYIEKVLDKFWDE